MQMSSILDSERYTLREAAQRLNVHVASVWRWVLHGVRGRKLPTVLIGGRRFVLRRDLEAFLDSGSSPSIHEQPPQRGNAAVEGLPDAWGVTVDHERPAGATR
jgi:hypothetical protein